MPVSKTDIFNLALGHLGVATEVQDPDADRSKEAQACRRFFSIALEETLRDAPWPFAKQYELLALVTSPTPISEFTYAYRYPANALFVRRILNGSSRIEDSDSRVKYRIGRDASGKLIQTDQAVLATSPYGPWVEYTYLETNMAAWHPDAALALSFLLGSLIGPRVASDKTKLLDRTYQLYRAEITKAKVNAYNEESIDRDVDSEFERSRI